MLICDINAECMSTVRICADLRGALPSANKKRISDVKPDMRSKRHSYIDEPAAIQLAIVTIDIDDMVIALYAQLLACKDVAHAQAAT